MAAEKFKTKEELLIENKQLETRISELENSEFKHSIWLENSPVCTKILDLDFNLQYMSNSGVRDLKIDDITEFYGKPYPLSFYPDSFKIPMTKNLKRAVETGETITQEAPIQDIEGNTLWYHSTIAPVNNDKGQLDHIMVVSLDTTTRKQAEKKLHQSEATIRNKLIAITEPKGDIGTLELSDIIDTEILRSLMEDFYQLTGMLGAVLDISGKVLVAVGWQDICTKFHRCSPDSLKNCIESDTFLTQDVPEGTFKAYHCKNNMWDIVTPIMVGERHVGNVFIGQYLLEGEVPDVELFRKQAQKYGFDEEDYLAALDEVPHFSKETVDAGMQFYSKLAGIISSLSFSTIQQSRALSERKKADEALKESEKRFRHAITYAPYPIMIHADGKVLQLSEEWTKQTGYNIDDIPTIKKWTLKAYGKDAVPSNEFIDNLYKIDKTQYDGEWEVKIKDGGYRLWDFSSSPIGELPNGNKMVISMASDITERKKAEEEIRVAKENLRTTFDISPSIISKANVATGYFVEVNQAVTRLLGYSVEEFTSKPLMEFVHPDDRQKTIDEITEQQKGNNTILFENRYLCKDTSYRWLAWQATKADENGIVTAIGSDISERKKIEQEIFSTKQFYENITEGVQDGIWVTDKNDVIFYANSAMEKIAGVPREQIQGNNVLKDFPEETTEGFNKFYKQAKKEKKPVWYDIKVKTPANKNTWQNGWLIPQYQNNAFTGIICTIRDITERRKAEGAVRNLSTAVQQSPVIVAITDTEGKLEYVNPIFTEITGYSNEEAIGQRSNILKSDKQDSSFYKDLWETLKSGKVWRGQFHNKKKNGELFWEAASISAILNESGEVVNYIKIGEDITKQKNTDLELKLALEKALESDRLKSSFLANMSHEIRTPMNGILGFLELINEPDLSKSEIDNYSAIINYSSDRLLNTINDIIDISKIEAGEMLVSKTKTSINNLMNELYSFFSKEAKKNGLSLYLETSLSNELATVITDSNKVHGILTNLIKNALKYTEKGQITFGYLVKKKTIEFFVEDSGIGIPQNRLQAIFNRFEQADSDSSRVIEGSGLGLAISKAYAEMLEGEIFVESEEGKGSKFTLTIPCEK